MNKRTVVLALSLAPLGSALAVADPFDGITLSALPGPAAGSIALEWMGGQPDFTVYRAGSPNQVVAPGHEIGVTSVRAFTDASPTGLIDYYVITSPCVYAPPEICDGVDNDCNGTIDDPGSEASCSLPNATAVCAAGACAIGSCNAGFGDCDGVPTDGCETDTHVAQSNSPESLWAGDPNPNQDLRPGYQRVPEITNCGACSSVDPAASCDDGISCTTDLCVPVGPAGAQTGVCSHYDRAQCAEARCGTASLPPGTPLPRDPSCTGPDTDGDGLSNTWETNQGIDFNCDGEISGTGGDMVWDDPPAGPATPDIYVHYDYMFHPPDPCLGPADCLFGEGCVGGMCTGHSDAPTPEAVTKVVEAFAAQGIVLHVDPNHEALPHDAIVYFPVQGPDACATPGNKSFYDIKAAHFDQKLGFTHRYVVFGHQSCSDTNPPATDGSGVAEVGGNDFIVTLAPFDFTYTGTATQIEKKRIQHESGTFMHELGHNLGLCHGGASDPNASEPCPSTVLNFEPNHVSSMNYNYQLAWIQRAGGSGTLAPLDPNVPRRADYSHVILDPLDEGSLDETQGMGPTPPPFDRDIVRYFCPGSGGPVMAPGQGPVDWNCDGVIDAAPVSVDLNGSGTIEVLEGSDDWSSLRYGFQCNPTFADGAQQSERVALNELTVSEAVSRRLLADATAYCDPGFDDCDGNEANGCETPVLDDADNCGGCGEACSANHVNPSCYLGFCNGTCDAGWADCNADKLSDGCETDPSADPAHCGACGQACSANHIAMPACTGGVCTRSCDAGFDDCDADKLTNGCETDLLTSESNCGFCGNACAPGQICDAGSCSSSCPAGPPNSLWTAPLPGVGTPTAPANDTSFNADGESNSYIAKGSTLHAIRNRDQGGQPEGSVKWSRSFLTPIPSFVNPVPLKSGTEAIYLSNTDDRVYGLDAGTGADLPGWVSGFDTRRMACLADTLNATPVVQLHNFSNPAFQTAHSEDLVIVITRTLCGDESENRVIAIGAGTGTVKWEFHPSLTYGLGMNHGSEGGSIDYAQNIIYFGTDSSTVQHTLWAISTIDGTRVWSVNAGAIRNRPAIRGGRVYTATYAGLLRAYDAAGGSLAWSTFITGGANITRSPWVETRGAYDR